MLFNDSISSIDKVKVLLFFARSLFQEMQKANLNYIDLHTPLFKARDAGESLYWKTDSHWNEKAVKISVEALEKVVQKYFTPE